MFIKINVEYVGDDTNRVERLIHYHQQIIMRHDLTSNLVEVMSADVVGKAGVVGALAAIVEVCSIALRSKIIDVTDITASDN